MREAGILLRPAMPADALDVATVHVRAWQAGYRGLLPDAYLDALPAEDRAARYTFGSANPDAPTTIVATIDGAIRGFATIGACADADIAKAGSLLALHVDPDAWRTGIGTRLLARAREMLVERGFAEATLRIAVGNPRAARFYEADGWSYDSDERTVEIRGISIEEFRYRRGLP